MRRLQLAIGGGALLTTVMGSLAVASGSCFFGWQICLMGKLFSIHGMHLTPAELVGVVFAILLGVPIYAFLIYVVLWLAARFKKSQTRGQNHFGG